MADFEIIADVASAVQEALKLKARAEFPEHNCVYLRGLTRFNFRAQIKLFKLTEWRIRLDANGVESKDATFEEHMVGLVEETDFVRTSSKRVQFEYKSSDINELVEAAESLFNYVNDRDLGSATVVESKLGVAFAGTQFDRLKERGATMSGMFGNLVCQASGMNLLMTQAEYYVDAGEIDGVEFDDNGKVISIYECQSGIHKGYALDEDHLSKVLGAYLYDSEIIPTVRKIVILAGAYDDLTMRILRERTYELGRRERPIELVVLITTRVENRIGVERVELGS
jgi:hypothetical protein